MGPTWGPSGADRTQVGPILAHWTLLSGYLLIKYLRTSIIRFTGIVNPIIDTGSPCVMLSYTIVTAWLTGYNMGACGIRHTDSIHITANGALLYWHKLLLGILLAWILKQTEIYHTEICFQKIFCIRCIQNWHELFIKNCWFRMNTSR